MKHITTVTPYRFKEKFWILAFDNTLISKFENIDFDVYVSKNRLYIRSQQIQK